MLMLCAWCQKMVLSGGIWQEWTKEEVEKAEIQNRGICPQCYAEERRKIHNAKLILRAGGAELNQS